MIIEDNKLEEKREIGERISRGSCSPVKLDTTQDDGFNCIGRCFFDFVLLTSSCFDFVKQLDELKKIT